MTDGRERFIKQIPDIKSGKAAFNFKATSYCCIGFDNKETTSPFRIFLLILNPRKPNLILKKQYPSKDKSLPVISRILRDTYSKFISQSEVQVAQEKEDILLNNRYESGITTTYPPTYNCDETLCIFNVSRNIFTN